VVARGLGPAEEPGHRLAGRGLGGQQDLLAVPEPGGHGRDGQAGERPRPELAELAGQPDRPGHGEGVVADQVAGHGGQDGVRPQRVGQPPPQRPGGQGPQQDLLAADAAEVVAGVGVPAAVGPPVLVVAAAGQGQGLVAVQQPATGGGD
jgi:hypothetical protein